MVHLILYGFVLFVAVSTGIIVVGLLLTNMGGD